MVLIKGKNYNASSPVVKRLAPDQYTERLSNQPTSVTAPAPTVVVAPAPLPVAPMATTVENTLTPEQRDRMYEQLTSMNISPANISTVNEKTLLEASFSPEELAAMPYYQQISQREGQRTELQQGLTNGQIPQPNSAMLRPLEEALKTKIGLAKEQLGQSELFSASGIDPYIALSNSLQEKSREMNDKYTSYANMMGTVGENLSASYGQALTNYKILQGQYDKEVERIDGIVKEEQAYKRQLELIEIQHNAEKDLKLWNNQHPDLATQANLRGQGYRSDGSGQIIALGSVEDIFDLSDVKSKYRATGLECGEGFNLITDGKKVEHTYKSKIGLATHWDDPSLGNGLVLPIGGKDNQGNLINGHIETVIGYDPATKSVSTVSWNKDGKGGRTFESYTIDELNETYGKGWGFTDSKLKPGYSSNFSGGDLSGAMSTALNSIKFGTVDQAKTAKEELQSLLSSGNIQGAKEYLITQVRNNASNEQQAVLDGKENSVYALESISNKLAEFVKQGGNTGIFAGKSEQALQKLGSTTDPKLAGIANDIAMAIIDYRRAVSGAAFTESEGAAYETVFPSIGKTPELNKAKIDSLITKFKSDTENFYKRRIGETNYNSIFNEVKDVIAPEPEIDINSILDKYFNPIVDIANKFGLTQK